MPHHLLNTVALALSLIGLTLALLLRLACADELPVLPDPTLTPGVVATTDQSLVCASGDESYSREHRQTSAALKRAVREEYHAQGCGEIDHRLPLSLGGADEEGNLWCQPGPPVVWNFKVKDRLEDRIWRMTCHEHTMDLPEAQAIFLAPDWRDAYCKYVGGEPCPVTQP